MTKDFLKLDEMSAGELNELVDLAIELKNNKEDYFSALAFKTLVMIFEKPSTRTLLSFKTGMFQLGGEAITLPASSLGNREEVRDLARVISRYGDGLLIRTFSQDRVDEFATHASIPVINGLTDERHPCQALADLVTIKQELSAFKGQNVMYIGDGFNVANSFLIACAIVGLNVYILTPKGYEPDDLAVSIAEKHAEAFGASIVISTELDDLPEKMDVVYTDAWVSMGKEDETSRRKTDFENYQLNAELLARFENDPIIMHCLPAHRDYEITDEVLESAKSVVFDQAENRLHAQKAVLLSLMKGKK
jgi:ornithine carbamoyltransferase